MIGLKRILLVICLIFTTDYLLYADPPEKKNLGFEKGNFDGWVGYQWLYSSEITSINTSPALVSLPTPRRHVIINDQSAYDEYTGSKLKKIPDGYKYSARLGDVINNNSDARPRDWEQSLRYTMTIDSTNALLIVKFACVLQYASDHTALMEPRFRLTLYDENDNIIPDCANYDVYASSGNVAGFQTYTPQGFNDPVKWRDWTTVGTDLTKYIGQEITIELMSADCTGQFHFGYAYFVADCMPMQITINYCTNDINAILSAPSGFSTYKWTDEKGNVAGSGQNLIVENPKEGEKYYCSLKSETGCTIDSLFAIIKRYEPKADFSSKMIDCFSNEVQIINNSTTNTGKLDYLWDFGDNSVAIEESPRYKFETSGMHEVGLIIYNPPSGCTDTLIKQVESFSPPLIGFSGGTTYCPGLETELTAFGAYSYQWSTGNSSKIVSFGESTTGSHWLLGYSTEEEGCVSDTIHFSISEEPNWLFALTGDTILCEGLKQALIATGAVKYSWNTGEDSDSIIINSGGHYTVKGENARGCVKNLVINVTEIPTPQMSFSLSANAVDKRHNEVVCSATSNDSVLYQWDMDDGTIVNASGFTHYYTIPSELITYNVSITATNKYGCINTQTADVIVDLYVPNVFTPNNDGVNDLFMPGFDIIIVDRHGILLYSGQSGWDGIYNGIPADPDTYFYEIDYADAYLHARVKRGFVTLIR